MSRRENNWPVALAFLAPNFLGFLAFMALPVLFSLVMAFTNWQMTENAPLEFVGFSNFADLLSDKRFWGFFGNTLYLMLGIPVSIAGSLFLAVILHQRLRGVVLFRTMFYLPTITSGVALFILWKAIFNPEFGPLNNMLNALFDALRLQATAPEWLLSVAWAKPAIMIMGIWTAVGGTNMLLYLAGLSNVPPELYEAAQLDGAGKWALFRHVTWPQLGPTTFFIVVMSAIGGLQGGFEQARVMTGGGPAESTITLGYYIYQKGFEEYQLGYASTIAWVMFIIIFVMTLINWKFGRSAFAMEV
ncbi:MAG: sugar ABC transporter permease [Armatimonadetes bacterium]|nr:sugar ABC transporter permease [Armatimonadota bacterium]